MSQWENLIIRKRPDNFSFNFTEQDWLNEEGKNGWKLVAVVKQFEMDSVLTYYFNRPKAIPKKAP